MKLKYKYLYFEDVSSRRPQRKTSTFFCWSKDTNYWLGTVEWFSRWRQYCFFPEPETVFNSTCLADISHFLAQLNGGHKKK